MSSMLVNKSPFRKEKSLRSDRSRVQPNPTRRIDRSPGERLAWGMNDDVRAKLESLERRQALLRQELAGLDETLGALKKSLASDPGPPPASPYAPRPAAGVASGDDHSKYAPPPKAAPVPPSVPHAPPDSDWKYAPPSEAVRVPPPVPAPEPVAVAVPSPAPQPAQAALPVPPPLPPQAGESSLEMRVGTVWLARIGIVIVLTGLVFLANYAWQSLLANFGCFAKLGVLYMAGGILCAAGWWIGRGRESLKSYAGVLIAGGAAAIYYTTYAAHYVPSLKVIESPLLAGVLLVAIAGIIGWLADRRNSQSTAGLAILLAFYASAVNPLAWFTLFSNTVLAIAAVVLMVRKRWMTVPFVALAATYWSYLYWRLAENWKFWEAGPQDGDADLTMRLAFLSVYWLTFTAGAFLTAGPKVSGAARIVFSTLNDAAFFSLAAIAISSAHHDSLWLVALVFGLLQAGLTFASRTVHGPGSPVTAAWLAKALFFLTLAILIRFTGNSLAIILAVECSLLVFAASKLPSRVLATAGPLAGILAMLAALVSLSGTGSAAALLVAALLVGNAWYCGRLPVFSLRAAVLALSGAATGAAAVVQLLPGAWEPAGPACLGLALVASLPLHRCKEMGFAGMLAACWSALMLAAALRSAGSVPSLVALGLMAATAVAGPLVAGTDKSIRVPGGILSVAVTLLFWAWIKTCLPENMQFWPAALLAAAALALCHGKPLRQAVAVILTLASLSLFADHGVGPHARFAAPDLFGCLLLLAGERLSRAATIPAGLPRFAGIAGLLALLAWVTSAVRFFHDPIPVTAAWAILALVVFFAGFVLRARLLRLGGLGILALALCHIFLFDVWRLDLPFRILSFLILGSVLLVLGYLYNRYEERIRRWL